MNICPNCGAQLNDDSLFCTECGKPIPQGNVCLHCGASMNEGDSFCQNCGKKVNESSTSILGTAINKCSFCGADITDGDMFCQNCGKRCDETCSSMSESTMNVCPYCGSAMNDGDVFCQNCGISKQNRGIENTNITNLSNQMSNNSSKKNSILPIAIVVCCLLFLALLGGGWWYYNYSISTHENENKMVSNSVADKMAQDSLSFAILKDKKNEKVVEENTPVITTIYDKKGEAIYTFSGEVVDNQPNGYGVLTYLKDNEIDRYEGHMVNGQREDNSAALFYKNGDIFRGAFKNDKFHIGTYYVDDSGKYFRGLFKNNKPWKGIWYDAHDYVIGRVENGSEK